MGKKGKGGALNGVSRGQDESINQKIIVPPLSRYLNDDECAKWLNENDHVLKQLLSPDIPLENRLEGLRGHVQIMKLFIGRFQNNFQSIHKNTIKNFNKDLSKYLICYFALLSELYQNFDPENYQKDSNKNLDDITAVLYSMIFLGNRLPPEYQKLFVFEGVKQFVSKIAANISSRDLYEIDKRFLCLILNFVDLWTHFIDSLRIDQDNIREVARRLDGLPGYQYIYNINYKTRGNSGYKLKEESYDVVIGFNPEFQVFKEVSTVLKYVGLGENIDLKNLIRMLNSVVVPNYFDEDFRKKVSAELSNMIRQKPSEIDLRSLINEINDDKYFILLETFLDHFEEQDLERLILLVEQCDSGIASDEHKEKCVRKIRQVIIDKNLSQLPDVMENIKRLRKDIATNYDALDIFDIMKSSGHSTEIIAPEIEKIYRQKQEIEEALDKFRSEVALYVQIPDDNLLDPETHSLEDLVDDKTPVDSVELSKARNQELGEENQELPEPQLLDQEESFGVKKQELPPEVQQLIDALEAKNRELSASLESSNTKVVELKGKNARLQTENSRLNNDLENKDSQIGKLEAENKTLNSSKVDLEGQKKDLLKRCRDLEKLTKNLASEITDLRERLEIKTGQMKQALQDAQSRYDKKTNEIDSLKAKIKNFEEQKQKRRSRVVVEQDEQHNELVSDLTNLQAELDSLQGRFSEEEERLLQQTKELEEAKLLLKEATEKAELFSKAWTKNNGIIAELESPDTGTDSNLKIVLAYIKTAVHWQAEYDDLNKRFSVLVAEKEEVKEPGSSPRPQLNVSASLKSSCTPEVMPFV